MGVNIRYKKNVGVFFFLFRKKIAIQSGGKNPNDGKSISVHTGEEGCRG